MVLLVLTLVDKVVPERMDVRSPIHHNTRLIDAFVDDTSLGFTDSGVLSCNEVIARLTSIAQQWEKLLSYSGGALNFKKCSWYIMYWEWREGHPYLRPLDEADPPVLLTQGESEAPHSIKRVLIDQACRILGVYLSPDNDFSQHLQVMKTKADHYAFHLKSPKLTANNISIFHRTISTRPAMKYSLPGVAVDEEFLAPVQSRVLAAMLNGLGVARTLSTSIPQGPLSMGGLALLDLRTEAGISAIKLLRDSLFAISETGGMLLLNLYYSQLESGIGKPLLSTPWSIAISYHTPT